MSDNDWDKITYLRKRQPKAQQLKSQQAINAAQRKGIPIETTKKFNAATNKKVATSLNTCKLDQETEELHHDTIGLGIAQLIQKHRQAKGFTQKELATRANEKSQVINEYEAGKAIPNQAVLAKLERILEVKLRGKDKGQALKPPAKGK